MPAGPLTACHLLAGISRFNFRYFSEEAEGTLGPLGALSLLCDFSPQGTKLSIRIGKRKIQSPFPRSWWCKDLKPLSPINPFFFQLNFRVHRIGIIKAMCSNIHPHEWFLPSLPSFLLYYNAIRMCKPKPKARTLAMIYIQSYSLPTNSTHNFVSCIWGYDNLISLSITPFFPFSDSSIASTYIYQNTFLKFYFLFDLRLYC